MQRKISISWTIVICVIVAVCTFLITFSAVNLAWMDIDEKYSESLDAVEDYYAQQFASLNEMYAALPEEQRNTELFKRLAYVDAYYRSLYVGEIDEERLTYYLMQGYISGIGDAYGEYYTADDLKTMMQQANGKLYGIGVSVVYSSEHDAIEILSVTEGSPADKAGILVGDIIIAVEGERVTLETYFDSLNKVKGEKGTRVNLTILRGETSRDVSAIRDEIVITTVTYHKYALDNSIGVIRVSEFNNETPAQLKGAVESLLNDGVKSLVFDMRNNPGGTLDSVIEILDYLLPAGDICYVVDAKGNRTQTYKSDADCVDKSVPMAVLINENTASAAELFTAALRDFDRATTVGVTSYGKGSMQTTYMLPDGAGIKLSTNTYNPPCDVNYTGIGITPDRIVDLDEALKDKSFYKLTDAEDNQLLEACRALGYTN